MMPSERMIRVTTLAAVLIISGCGLVYQAGTRIKASRMADRLKVGETSVQVHRRYGEPALREYPSADTEVWSYAYKPNSNDITAQLLYTSTKEGDRGTFLDLKFVDGKLVIWSEAVHTVPAKQAGGFGAGFGAPPISPPGGAHY
jgi:hypothetical protein